MRLTSSGQVSVPAEVRRRWATTRVRIVDHGGHLVVEPESEQRFAKYVGRFAGPGPSGDELRDEDRRAEEAAEARKAVD